MKKKIAVFATGWSEQMIYEYMTGIRDGFANDSADVYMFVCYPALIDDEKFINGELNIFNLPNINDFDGVLVLGNGIDYPQALKSITDRCKLANVPIVFTGHKNDDAYFVGTDNYSGAKNLCEHLYDVHGARDFFYIAGSKDNMDSNMRLKALEDVVREKGGEFTQDNVFYSNWDPRTARLFVREWIVSGRKLPDVFVCANDELAILLCAECRDYGINVPDDVLVTGFDNLLYAQVYDPSICSVSQRFDKVGYESAKLILDILSGRPCTKDRTVLCEFMPGESCGCNEGSHTGEIRREIGRNRFTDDIYSSAFYRKLSIIDRAIMKSSCYEEIKTNFKEANDSFNNYEGNSYHILIDPVYIDKMSESEKVYRKSGYAEKMDVMFSMDEGNYMACSGFESRMIVPQVVDCDKNHLYICLPLHDAGACLGYVVFADDYKKLRSSELLGKYVERLSTALVKLQQTLYADVLNKKLIELSETDALTHVKNRMAYQMKEEEMNQRIRFDDELQFALLLCDVNNLKLVNDKWGHENGDIYIKNACALICKTFKRSAVYRIGGDEFVVVLQGDDYNSAVELLASMNNTMDDFKNKDIPVWDKISVAAGLSRYDRGNDKCLADVLKRADDNMYNRKQIMKNNL